MIYCLGRRQELLSALGVFIVCQEHKPQNFGLWSPNIKMYKWCQEKVKYEQKCCILHGVVFQMFWACPFISGNTSTRSNQCKVCVSFEIKKIKTLKCACSSVHGLEENSRKLISVDDWCQVEKSDPSQGTSGEHFPNRA